MKIVATPRCLPAGGWRMGIVGPGGFGAGSPQGAIRRLVRISTDSLRATVRLRIDAAAGLKDDVHPARFDKAVRRSRAGKTVGMGGRVASLPRCRPSSSSRRRVAGLARLIAKHFDPVVSKVSSRYLGGAFVGQVHPAGIRRSR